jgi:putative hemolysin
MSFISRLAAPIVWLLDVSSTAVIRLLGTGPERPTTVTDEEIHALIAEAEGAGTIETAERDLITGVMRLADRPVRAVMTPRMDVEWLDLAADEATIRTKVATSEHSLLAVGEGSYDALIGVVRTRELLAQMLNDGNLDVRRSILAPPTMPDTGDALIALEALRKAEVPIALIYDEYGHFEGLVTPADLLEAIAGEFQAQAREPGAVQRDDGSWLLSGSLQVEEMAMLLGLQLPDERDYHTAAGYVLRAFRRLPATGDRIELSEWRLEVVDMDGNRIDKILASPVTPPA